MADPYIRSGALTLCDLVVPDVGIITMLTCREAEFLRDALVERDRARRDLADQRAEIARLTDRVAQLEAERDAGGTFR